MRRVSKEQIYRALQAVGIQAGDGVLVHSALQYLGAPIGGVEIYYQAVCEALGIHPGVGVAGAQGTLCVPTFNFGFARGEAYDPQATPSQGMGAFSEYVRTRPEARRTPHPMQSLAVVGAWAEDLAGRDTPSAFDPGSAFERMVELDFKLLLLGADVQSISILHLSEQRCGVPYRYWKEFTGLYKTAQGWERRTYRMFARDLEIDAHIELYPVQRALQSQGKWRAVPLNYGQVASCRLVDFVATVDQFLQKDPWALVVNRPGQVTI